MTGCCSRHHALSRTAHSALPSLHPGTGGATALLGKCGIWTGEQCTVGIWLMLGNKKSCRCAVQWHFWSTLLPFWLEFEYIWPKFKDVFRNHCLDIFSHTSPRVQCSGGLFVPIIPSLAFDDDLDPGPHSTRPDTVSPARERCRDGAAVWWSQYYPWSSLHQTRHGVSTTREMQGWSCCCA